MKHERGRTDVEAYRVGRTINTGGVSSAAPERSRVQRRWGRFVLLVLLLGALAAGGVMVWQRIRLNDDVGGQVEATREPRVEIVNEVAGTEVSARVKLLVVRLEDEAAERGLQLVRVVLPRDRQRQVDVYLEGRAEYYKVSVDRSAAVTMEDVARVVKYLDGEGLKPGYVDVRVAGKAYYK